MHRACVPLLLGLALSCSPAGPAPAGDPPQEPVQAERTPAAAPLVGAYRALPLFLRLDAGGTYALEVLQMVDGCATVRGNGYGTGRWSRTDDIIRFEPEVEQANWILEPHDLAVTFEGAQAVPAGNGLALTLASGTVYSFERCARFPGFFSGRAR